MWPNPYWLLAFVVMPIVIVLLGWAAAWAHVGHSSNMTESRRPRSWRLPDLPLWVIGVLGSAVAGLFVYTMLDTEIRTEDKKRASTPRLVEECHKLGGSAVVAGARHIYESCVLPPPGKDVK